MRDIPEDRARIVITIEHGASNRTEMQAVRTVIQISLKELLENNREDRVYFGESLIIMYLFLQPCEESNEYIVKVNSSIMLQ